MACDMTTATGVMAPWIARADRLQAIAGALAAQPRLFCVSDAIDRLVE